MGFDEIKSRFEFFYEYGAQDERDAEAQGIHEQHDAALQDMALLGCQHQGGTEKCAYAGSPSYGKNHTEHKSGKRTEVAFVEIVLSASEQVHFDDIHIHETEENHHDAGDQIYGCLIVIQKAAQGTGHHAQEHEYDSESRDEAD